MKTKLLLFTALLGFSSCTKIAKEPVNPSIEEINEGYVIKYGNVLFTSDKKNLLVVISSNQYSECCRTLMPNSYTCESAPKENKYTIHPGSQTYTVYTTKLDNDYNTVPDKVYKTGSINVGENSCNTINID